MTILLDTHILLWFLSDPDRLTDPQQSALRDPANALIVSTVSLVEIGIKFGLGKLLLPVVPDLFFPPFLAQAGVKTMPIEPRHAYQIHLLPLHHRDPFDRILIAQAIAEKIPLMTADPQFKKYGLRILS